MTNCCSNAEFCLLKLSDCSDGRDHRVKNTSPADTLILNYKVELVSSQISKFQIITLFSGLVV